MSETHIRNDQTRRCSIITGVNFDTKICLSGLCAVPAIPDSGPFLWICECGAASINVSDAGLLHSYVRHPSPDYTRGREQGLRDALEAVKYVTDRNHRGYLASIEVLIEALLPRDPVKALVDGYQEDICVEWLPDTRSWLEAFARHLHTTGRLATQGEVR